MVFCNSNISNLVIVIILMFSSFILFSKNNFGTNNIITNDKDVLDLKFLQNSYAFESSNVNSDLSLAYGKSKIYYIYLYILLMIISSSEDIIDDTMN